MNGKPVDGTCQVKGPFHLAIDQQDRIWITNGGADTVTRFPASDPTKAELIKVGFGPRAIAIDSLGNAWVCNALGSPGVREKAQLLWDKLKAKVESFAGSKANRNKQAQIFHELYETALEYAGGDVSLLHPDGTQAPNSPFDGAKSINGPWGIAIDGNDNIWVANAMGRSITELCGVRTATCPPGLKTGDPISPPGGYIGGLQIITDVAVDPAGNIWVANNWDQPDQGFKTVPDPALSTRFGGNGFVVFFGLAKPVHTPLIGPNQPPKAVQ